MLKQTNKHINKDRSPDKENKTCRLSFILVSRLGQEVLICCFLAKKFVVRMQDVFRISPYTGHYSFHFELKIHMASLIKSMQG